MSSDAARLAQTILELQDHYLKVDEEWVENRPDGFTYWPATIPQHFTCRELPGGALRWVLDMPLVERVTKPEDAMWVCMGLNTYAAGWCFHYDKASRTLAARAAASVPDGWDRLLVRFAQASTLAAWFCEQTLEALVHATGGVPAVEITEFSGSRSDVDEALYLPTVFRERPEWVINGISDSYPPLEELANYAFQAMGGGQLACELEDSHFNLERTSQDGAILHRVRAGFSQHPLFGVGWRTDVVFPVDWGAGFNIGAVMESVDRLISDPEAQLLGAWVATAEAVVYQSWATSHELRSYEQLPSFSGHDVHPLWGLTAQSTHALVYDPRGFENSYTGTVGHSEAHEKNFLAVLGALRSGAATMFPEPSLSGGRADRDLLWWVERELLVVFGWFNPMGPTISSLEIRENPETGVNHLIAFHRHPVVPRYEDVGPCDGEAWQAAVTAGLESLCVGSIPHMATLEFCPEELRDDVVAALAKAMDCNVRDTDQSYPDAAQQIRENMGEPWALAGEQRSGDYEGEVEALPKISSEADVYDWLGVAAHPLNTSSFWRHVPEAWDGSLNHLSGSRALNRSLLDVGPLYVTYSDIGTPQKETDDASTSRKPSFVPEFSTGLARAQRLRRHILDQLGATQEWVVGEDQDPVVRWVAGPLGTRLSATQAHDTVPGLGYLRIATAFAHVTDLAEARKFVEERNHAATLSRWQLVGDPGGPVGRVPYDAPIHVELSCSFVVGRPEREMPTVAMILAVGEQIAEASVAATEGIGWGRIAHGTGPDGSQRQEGWDKAVWFLADQLDPHSGEAPNALLAAAGAGFEAAVEEQAESGVTWWGEYNDNGLACMVPYGDGPFPDGMVGRGDDNPISQGEASSAMVNVLPWNNQRAGRGVLVGMRVPFTPIAQALPWMVTLLNSQSTYSRRSSTPGFAHGVGAWVERNGEPNYTCLIPSYWQALLSADDLKQVFRVLLENCARLSWDAGYVLGDPARKRYTTAGSDLRGFTAGSTSAGPLYGEDGKGTEPGAQAIEFVWRNLVVDEPQWAWVYTDGSGFRYWMGPATVDIAQAPCACPQTEGSLVKIRTDLCRDSEPMRSKLREFQSEGAPMSFGVDDGTLYAMSQLHLHADTVRWGERWTVPLAVAQVLIAEQLGTATDRGIELATPEGELRPDRDEMLTLWDDRAPWTVAKSVEPDVAVLLHSLACSIENIYSAEIDSWNGFSLDWLMTYSDQRGTVRSDEIETSIEFVKHPQYGPSLRLRSEFELSQPGVLIDAVGLNGAADLPLASFVLGGFHNTAGGIACTHLYPLALDRGERHVDWVAFSGTALNHHLSSAREALRVPEVSRVGGFHARAVAGGIQNLLHTYQAVGGASKALNLEVDADDPRFVRVEWSRPWASMDEPEWPRFGARVPSEDGHLKLRGSVLVEAFDPSSTAMKLVHCALATSARPNQRWGASRALLSDIAAIPEDWQLSQAFALLVERGVLHEESYGRFVIRHQEVSIGEVTLRRTEDHPAWELAVVIDVDVSQRYAKNWADRNITPFLSLDVGEWIAGANSLNYRVCLPPYLFVTLHPFASQQLIIDLVRSIADGLREGAALAD